MTLALEIEREKRMSAQEGRKEGVILALYNLYLEGVLALDIAAQKARMSTEHFLQAGKLLSEETDSMSI